MKKILLVVLTIVLSISCVKPPVAPAPASQQDTALIRDWIAVQLQLIKNTTGVTHVGYARHFAYTGVALYQALDKAQTQQAGDDPLFAPAAMNAAIADMLRFFYGGKEGNKASIDSLEALYATKFFADAPQGSNLAASSDLGKDIASNVILISQQDGAANASIPYTPLGEGFWEPTAPAYAAANVPGWGNNKTVLNGSISNINCPEPLPFSSDPGSSFYAMVKEVHEASKNLTTDQIAMARFWDDAPNGKCYTAFGHWYSILKQALELRPVPLQKASRAYLQLGISMNDAAIRCWKAKYTYNQIRPITYIRKYMGDASWNPLITTPPHPEYVAAHATLSSAAAYALEAVLGKNFAFTDHSYDNLGMQPRHFSSFEAAGTEAGLSRMYGGIHFRPSIEAGKQVGKAVAANVHSLLQYPSAFQLLKQ